MKPTKKKALALTSFFFLVALGFLLNRIYPDSVLMHTACNQDGLDKYLAEQTVVQFKKHKISGSLLVSKNGQILSKVSCGVSDPQSRKAVSETTLFNIGSLSKQFTGYLVLELILGGRLSLDDKIEKFIPELATHPFGSSTIQQLTNMTGGIPYNFPAAQFLSTQLSDRIYSQEEMISAIGSLGKESKPGEKFIYSNLGYNLLGIIISRVEQKPWSQVLDLRIFSPFGMKYTQIEGDRPERPKNLAVGLFPIKFLWKTFFLTLPHWNYSMIKGAGGIVSTVKDMHLWNEELTQKALRDPKWGEQYFSNRRPSDESYSFGWLHSETNLPDGSRIQTFNHAGQDPGYCASVLRLAKENTHIILTTNTDYCAFNDGAYRTLMRAILSYVSIGSKEGFK